MASTQAADDSAAPKDAPFYRDSYVHSEGPKYQEQAMQQHQQLMGTVSIDGAITARMFDPTLHF